MKILQSIKNIADEISHIVDDDDEEDDSLLYPASSVKNQTMVKAPDDFLLSTNDHYTQNASMLERPEEPLPETKRTQRKPRKQFRNYGTIKGKNFVKQNQKFDLFSNFFSIY